ncbi:MAG: hypothetical protein JJE28_07580 [Actinomycetales bacterium]|nr:hypothetical protein [Actinomycetales bacterium]
MTNPIKPLTFDLRYRKEAYIKVKGKMVRNSEQDGSLPDRPAQFATTRGSYGYIATLAARLNEAQYRSGFLHYLFFPEVAA